jgi:hypothetical protein
MRHCSSGIYYVQVGKELKIIPVYNVAKRKNTIGRIVCAVKGNLRESRRRVDRENKQSRMSCPMDAQSLSAICFRAIMVRKETRNGLMKGQGGAYFKRVEDHIQFDRVLTAD